MKKRILSTLLALCMVIGMMPVPAFATSESTAISGSCGDGATWRYDNINKVLHIEGSGPMDNYDCDHNGTTGALKSTTAPWFLYHQEIESVVIGNGITNIGKSAFEGCSSLTDVTIPHGITSIGTSAFESCINLTNITIPDGVSIIGDAAFLDCRNLVSVTIPYGVVRINNSAFNNCLKLSSITIPDSVTSIGNYAFQYCSSLANIIIPNGVTNIGESAFYGCSSLTSIDIPNGVTNIGASAFGGCSSLTYFDFPNSITDISGAIFARCSNLVNVTIPDSVTTIGYSAFEYCTRLTSIIIPNSVTSIGGGAFFRSGLKSITIPDSVTTIGDYAFNNDSVIYTSAGPIGGGYDIEFGWTSQLPKKAFNGCHNLTSITIPDSITSIGDNAFESCRSLASIIIPSGVTSIGSGAFSNCENLISITIPNGVATIGVSTFWSCTKLASVSIPSSVTSIEQSAFSGCGSLTDVYYSGSEADWETISIDSWNSPLTKATIHYNSTGPDGSEDKGLEWGNKDAQTLEVGKTLTMTVQMADGSAVDASKLTWTINPALGTAEIVEQGQQDEKTAYVTLKGIAPGKVTLHGTLVVGESILDYPTVSQEITVIGQENISFDQDTYSVKEGETVTATVSVPNPDGLTASEINFSCVSGDESVASVTSWKGPDVDTGLNPIPITIGIRGLKAGTATIIANVGDGRSASCEVTVTHKVVGPDVTWELNGSTLTISGTGAMEDYEGYDEEGANCAPWIVDHKLDIEKVIIESGITRIGDYAFFGCSNIKEIEIGEDVTQLGTYSLFTAGYCEILFRGNVPARSDSSFPLYADIYYPSDKPEWGQFAINGINNVGDSLITFAPIENRKPKLTQDVVWAFTNDDEGNHKFVENKEDGYYITQSDYNKLVGSLSKSDQKLIDFGQKGEHNKIPYFNIDGNSDSPQNWTGSCYGMSALLALTHSGIIPLHDIDPDASVVSDVDQEAPCASLGTQSVINFYHRQQKIGTCLDIATRFMRKNQSVQLKILEEQVSRAEAAGNMALISFGLREYMGSGEIAENAHTVLGYAIEYGDYEFTITDPYTKNIGSADADVKCSFNKRILIYDPNSTSLNPAKDALYFNDSEWAMIGTSGYKIFSKNKDMKLEAKDNNAQLQWVSADSDVINAVDYSTGEKNIGKVRDYTYLYTAGKNFGISSIGGNLNIQNGMFDGETSVSKDDQAVVFLLSDANEESNDNTYVVSLPKLNAYRISSEKGNTQYMLAFDNYCVSAASVQPSTIAFGVNGDVSLSTDSGSGKVYASVTANDGYTPLPWHTIEADCEGASTLSLSLSNEGVVIAGDNLTDTTIIGINDNGEEERASISTTENEALITEKDDKFEILVDTDDDGTYETPIDTTPASTTYTVSFDANGGTISGPTVLTTDANGKLTSLPVAERSGYTFDGWHTAKADGEKVDENYPFTENTTLYAHWTEDSKTEHTHSWATAWSSDANGHWHNCTANGCPITTNSEKNGYALHTSDGGKITTAATAYRDGVRTYSCTVCSYVISTERIPATGGSSSSGGSPASSGGGSSSGSSYSVSVPSRIVNGTVRVNPRSAQKGTTVTITVTPDTGYKLEKLTVTDRKGSKLELTDKGNGKYTFIMPAGTVKVETSFVLAETPETSWVNSFTDVAENAWYFDAVRFANENRLMSGYGNGLFGPNDTLTRAQFAQILYNKEGRPTTTDGNSFTDVDTGVWYANAVSWAAEQGIVSGYGNGIFGPNDPITREQLAIMLWRYAGSPAATEKELHFTDIGEAGDGSMEALRWAVENGVMGGYGDGRLNPKGLATRAQVAQMLKNYLER